MVSNKQGSDSNWSRQMHYARLSSVLSNLITLDDLLVICSELNVSPQSLNLSSNLSQKELVMALSMYLYQQARFEELFEILDTLYPHIVRDWLQKRPSETWLPLADVPEYLLTQVDNLLGEKRTPHFGYEFYDEPTGCYCWPFVSPIAQGMFPELKYKIIERLRLRLKNESVIAFIGQQSFYDISHIIIAPTIDQLDIVRIACTQGPILDIDCGNIVDELQVINEQYGIDIIGADDRVVILRLKSQLQGIERDEFMQWLDIFADEVIWSIDFSGQEYVELIFD